MDHVATAIPAGTLLAELEDTRRRLAEAKAQVAELSDRDTHLRIAMQASQVVAYQWDIVNDRVTRLRSISEPGAALEDAGTFESIVAKVLPEDQAVFRADIGAALGSADGFYKTQVRYRRADGEVRWVSETGRVVRGMDGRPARMVGVTFDITDQKATEEALRAAEAQLREQAGRKDEFLAMLAHELRNPLAPILNAVHILRHAGPGNSSAGVAHDMIERQVSHLVRLVDDLLDISRVSYGKIALRMEAIDLRDVVGHALDVSRPLLDSRRHVLEVSLPDHVVPVQGDFTRLAQVLANLLNNAAKYTDPGGRVDLTVGCEGAAAVIRVRDNGRGLEAADLEHVFELFYQAGRDLDRADGGLGLGLSLVQRLVELHGGSAGVQSAGRGRGTLFWVRIPLGLAPGEQDGAYIHAHRGLVAWKN